MSMTPEGLVKKQICEYLTRFHSHHYFFWVQESVGIYDAKRGIYRKKNSPWQIRGVADICGVYSWSRFGTTPLAVPLYFEVKAPTSSRVSDDQKKFIKNVMAMGGFAFIVKSVEDVIKALKSCDASLDARGCATSDREKSDTVTCTP